jgi:hypothetical protein
MSVKSVQKPQVRLHDDVMEEMTKRIKADRLSNWTVSGFANYLIRCALFDKPKKGK